MLLWFCVGLLIAGLIGLLIEEVRETVVDEDRKKIEAMGRAGIIYANRLSKDKKPSDEISRPIKENGFEQHKKVLDTDHNS